VWRLLNGGVKIPKITRMRIVLAFAVSVIADVLQFPISGATATGILAIPGEAADVALDVVVMVITSALLGFHTALLPSFVLELVRGLDLLPTWTGCVAFVVWRRKQAEARAAGIPAEREIGGR
jgi:hypothetical protein